MSLIDKSWYKRMSGVPDRTSAGGVIVRVDGDKTLVALVREGDDADYILPKGKVEKGESLEEAAEREIGEEAGISKLEQLAFLGVESRMTYKKDKWVTTHYFLFRTPQIVAKPTDDAHDYETEWFDIRKLPEMLWPEQKALIVDNLEKILKLASD
ncbi:MAG: NUDIX domain-containing protein [Bdellovibrionia bacterium]